MINCIFVGIGGFVGSVLRYLVGLIKLNDSFVFPIKTLCVNVIGAFLIGMITALCLKGWDADPKLILMLKVGVCGGFTTFSTFALESVQLFSGGRTGIAILYIGLSVVLSVGAVLLAESIIA